MSPAFPDFVIAGALRSGTTSLARYLGSHPAIYMVDKKELHFFDGHFERGLSWYSSQFDQAGIGQLRGEATPAYLSDRLALHRMAEVLPHASIIVSLRDPVARLWSHFWMRVERGHETRGFDDVLAAELTIYRNEGPDSADLVYLKPSLYSHHIGRLIRLFPRKHIHVSIFERMINDPSTEYRKVCRFLGVNDSFLPPNLGAVINPYVRFRSLKVRSAMKRWRHVPGLTRALTRLNTQMGSSYLELDTPKRALLTDFFALHNSALEELLGAPIPEWPQRPGTSGHLTSER